MTGYLHPFYAKSLAEFGQPLELPQCGGWILKRQIPNSPYSDAMGCYPLFCCRDWSKLRADLDTHRGDLVSLTLSLDPFMPQAMAELEASFDVVKPFKDHFVVDLTLPIDKHVNQHHRYYARKSLRTIKVETVGNPSDYLEEWCHLYENLIQRHQLRGIKAFSKACFAQQLMVPGLVMFRATCGEEIVGAHLWYVQGQVAHSHLLALNATGYGSNAAYGIYWVALHHFKEHFGQTVRYLDLGAGAGVKHDLKDGLSRFKSGWSNDLRIKYFAGSILNHRSYTELCQGGTLADDGYFPTYRSGEF